MSEGRAVFVRWVCITFMYLNAVIGNTLSLVASAAAFLCATALVRSYRR